MGKPTPEDQAAAVVAMYVGGSNGREIAEALLIPQNTVYGIVERSGVARRTKSKAQWLRLPQETEAAIKLAYDSGEKPSVIAEGHRVAESTVRRVVRRLGGLTRSRSEANRRYDCDHHYFDAIDTEAKAYWLGFLMADGCVTSGYVKLGLARKDSDHVGAFTAAVRAGNPVRLVGQGKFSRAEVAIRSDDMVAGLARLGVVPRKSMTAEPPGLPEALVRHFWRGAFDGDGCIHHNEARRVWSASFVGSRAMVEAFASFARAVSGSTARAAPRGNVWCFQLGGRGTITRTLAALYDNASVFLHRKHRLYLQTCNRTD